MDETRSIPLRPDSPANPPAALVPGDTVDKGEALSAELAAAPPVRVTRNTGAIPTGLTPAESREFPVVPGYEVLGILGHGGMGIVYRARQLKANRIVALKMIRAYEHATPQERLRFQIETEAVARLQHPHIVQLHEVGEIAGQPFFSLEFCAGGTLSHRLTTWHPSPREAADLIETLARAMHYAHLRGVVHRDLKPGNVLFIGEPGGFSPGSAPGADATGLAGPVPKITDFGLAKRLDAEARDVSQTGTILGTPAYMAPEQAAGKVRDTGPGADVYALGAILYECLSGHPPFRGETTLETLRQVVHEEPAPLSRLTKKLPRDLATICHKCLAKEPGRRYTDAAALADDLRRFREGESIQARPMGFLERVMRWAKRRPAAATALAATLLALIFSAALVASSSANRSLGKARQAAEDQRSEAEKQRRRAEEALQREELSRYYLHIILAEREWAEGHAARTEELLDACPEALRGWEWHYLKKQCHAELWTVRAAEDVSPSFSYASLSQDGRWAAWAVADNSIQVWDTATGKVRATLRGHPGREVTYINSLTFSLDGRYLISTTGEYLVQGDLIVWDLDKGRELMNFPGLTGRVSNAAFSPDGRCFAVSSGERDRPGEVWIWDLESGEELLRLFDEKNPAFQDLAFSPDGTMLAAISGENDTFIVGRQHGKVTLWDAASGRPRLLFNGHPDGVTAVAFSPDGRQVASSGEDGKILLWDPNTGQVRHTMPGRTSRGSSLAFEIGGERLASCGDDHTVHVWNTVTGKEVVALHGHAGEVQAVAFNSQKLLLSVDSNRVLKVWNPEARPEALTFRDGAEWVTGVAFSPDGLQLASSDVDGKVTLREVSSGRILWSRKVGEKHAWAVAFSRDGKRLAVGLGDWKKPDEPVLVLVLSAATGVVEQALPGQSGLAWAVAFGPGRLLASAGSRKMLLHDLDGGPTRALEGAKGGLSDVAFSPDDLKVAAINDVFVRVWEISTGKELYTLRALSGGFYGGLAFSPDGGNLAVGDGMSVRIWDAQGKQRSLLRGTDWIQAVVFSPDGKRLATGYWDGTIKIWDWEAGQEIITLRGHSGKVWSLAFSPDGKRLASGGQDGTLKIWDADRGTEPDVRRVRH